MNDSTPFDTIHDEPLEARIVAWVLGEASAFEAAELERLCEERPELLVFRRRMRALHGLLTETEAAEPDDAWKLPPEKRKTLEELFGEETPARPEHEKETQIRRSGRRALMAIAACVTLAFVVIRLLPREYESEMIIEVKPRETGVSPLTDSASGSAGSGQMNPQFFATEFDKIKSRNSLSKVVDTLELENRWQVDKETAIRMLKDSVATENLKGTDLIALRVRNANAEDAKNIASEVARAYKEYRTEIEGRYADKGLYELNKAVRDQEDKVEERRKVLATIVRTKGIIYKGQDSFYGSSGVNEDQGAQSALETYNQVEQEKRQLESQINGLLKYDGDQLTTYAGGLNLPDNVIKNLYPQYLQEKQELNKLKTQGLGDGHPSVKAAKEQIEGMKRQMDEGVVSLRATLQAQANLAADRLKAVETRRDDTREEAIKRGLDAQDYVDAKRDFETDQELLQQMKLKQVAETITNKLPHDSIEVHDDPQVTTRFAIPFFSKTPAPGAVASNEKGDLAARAPSSPPPSAAPQMTQSASAAAGERTRMLSPSERPSNELADRSALAGEEKSSRQKVETLPALRGMIVDRREDSKPAAESAPVDGKSDLAAADGARWSSRDENTARPERPRVVPPGAKSKPAVSNVEASGALPDVDHDSRFSRKLMDNGEVDGSKPNGSASTHSAYGDVVDSLLSSAPGQPKSSADSPASGPVSAELAMEVEELKKSGSATGAGGGGGVGTAFGLAKREGVEFKEKTSMDKNKDGSWLEEAANQLQSETAAATGVTAGDLDVGGAVDAPAVSGTFAPNGGFVGGEIPAKLGYQMKLSDSELDRSLGAPEIQVPEERLQDLSEGVTNGLRMGDQAINRNNIDAILSNPNKPVDGAAADSFAADPQQASASSDDLIRNNAALTQEQTGEGDKIRRGLYMGEGNLNLGKYDLAKTEYEKVLRDEPNNSAARLGLEKVEAAQSDYYRAANDQTRAELLMQVDKAWELKIPAEAASDKSLVNREIVILEERAANLRKQLEDPALNDSKKQTQFKEWKETQEKLQELAKEKETAGKEPVMDEAALVEKASKIRKILEDPANQEINKQAYFREWQETQVKLQEIAKSKAKAIPAKKSPLESIEEIAASEEAYSTFSLNINDASFQIAKAALDKGERPDPEAIKVEQFYNAVDYGDPAPASNEPVAARIEQAAHPIIPGRNLVRVSLKTAAAGRGASQPLRLTLLVDQSGSMVREDRRTAMSNALKQLGGLLTPNDHITVVGFSRESHLLADNWTGDKAGKLGDLVNQTASEGGTNLEQAINLAEQMAARPHPAGEQNRIVLFTDGAANLGNANPERLAERVKSLRQKGIAFDIAGIGADGVNDRLLSELARNGNGRYYVVSDEKNESFARQLAGAFRPAAENVKVQVHFNPERVGRYKLIGFEKDRLKTEDFRNDAVDAAELAAEEAGVAIYQVETLPQGSGEIGEVSVRFRDTSKGEMVERKWTMPFESTTQVFDRATPSMQLAGLSMLAAEKLKGGPLADAIDFKQLSGSQSLVKQFYGSSPRVADMLHVIDLLK